VWPLFAVCVLLAWTPTASAQSPPCGGPDSCCVTELCDAHFECAGDCTCQNASPIIIDTTGEGFHLTSVQRGVVFDIAATGHRVQMAWTGATSNNAFLSLDRNGNGKIDNGKELFGNFTDQPPCPDGGRACRNGYRALAEFDKPENGGNGDGIIDKRDAVFSQLLLWIDENHDGISQPYELHTLPELGVFSLALSYKESKRTDKFDNWFRYKAAVNPDPQDGESKDGRWMFDVIFNTTGRDDRALPLLLEGLNPPSPECDQPPTISGPTTLWWFKGLSQGVSGYANQITLSALPSSGTYQWNIAAGSDKVSLSNSTTNNVQVTGIGQSTKLNDVSITATVNGQASAPFALTVRAPYALGTDPNQRTPVYFSQQPFVWETDIYYQVLDNLLSPMPVALPVNEYFTTGIIPDYSGTNWDHGDAGCAQTASDATFPDGIQGEYSNYTPTPAYETNWTGVKAIHWGQDWHIGTCTNGSGPRAQSDVIQKWTDHALHTNIVSPAP
jgi:hypothetical protein